MKHHFFHHVHPVIIPDNGSGHHPQLLIIGICAFLLILLPACHEDQKPGNTGLQIDDHRCREGIIAGFAANLGAIPVEQRDSAVRTLLLSYPRNPIIENDTVFSLIWAGSANQVLINGDLQHGWSLPDTMTKTDCGTIGFHFITYSVPNDSRLDYLLKIDSTDTTDPRNPQTTPSGYGPRSEVAMPGFIPNPVRHPKALTSKGTTRWLPFANPGGKFASRLLRVYIPAGYDTLKDLPSVYVTDGIEAADYMDYSAVLDTLIAARKITPLIVVFIPPSDRNTENISAETPGFIDGICDELAPFIDRTFLTSPDPADRAITGISSGGHLALMALFRRPDVFLNASGQSPTFTKEVFMAFDDFHGKLKERAVGPAKIRTMINGGDTTVFKRRVSHQDESKSGTGPRLYIDVGRFDLIHGGIYGETFLQSASRLHEKLDQAGIQNRFIIANDGHAWASWRERTDVILQYFFGTDR